MPCREGDNQHSYSSANIVASFQWILACSSLPNEGDEQCQFIIASALTIFTFDNEGDSQDRMERWLEKIAHYNKMDSHCTSFVVLGSVRSMPTFISPHKLIDIDERKQGRCNSNISSALRARAVPLRAAVPLLSIKTSMQTSNQVSTNKKSKIIHSSMEKEATVILENKGAPPPLLNENNLLSIDSNAAIKTETSGLSVGFDDGSDVSSSVGRFDVAITCQGFNAAKQSNDDFNAAIKTETSGFSVGFDDGSKDGSGIGDFDNKQNVSNRRSSIQRDNVLVRTFSVLRWPTSTLFKPIDSCVLQSIIASDAHWLVVEICFRLTMPNEGDHAYFHIPPFLHQKYASCREGECWHYMPTMKMARAFTTKVKTNLEQRFELQNGRRRRD